MKVITRKDASCCLLHLAVGTPRTTIAVRSYSADGWRPEQYASNQTVGALSLWILKPWALGPCSLGYGATRLWLCPSILGPLALKGSDLPSPEDLLLMSTDGHTNRQESTEGENRVARTKVCVSSSQEWWVLPYAHLNKSSFDLVYIMLWGPCRPNVVSFSFFLSPSSSLSLLFVTDLNLSQLGLKFAVCPKMTLNSWSPYPVSIVGL